MKRHGWKILLFFLTAVLVAGFFLPWKQFAQSRVISMLESKGLSGIAFQLESVGLNKAVLTDIVIGKAQPLLLKRIEIAYSPYELLSGQLQDLALSGLDIHVTQDDSGWHISGMDALAPSSQSGSPFSLVQFLSTLPFSKLSIEDSHVQISGQSLAGTLPFAAVLSKEKITLEVKPSEFSVGDQKYALSGLNAALALQPGTEILEGLWNIVTLDDGEDGSLPVLSAQGTIKLDQSVLNMDGNLQSLDKTVNAAFAVSANFEDISSAALKISDASYALMAGSVSVKSATVLLFDTKPVTLNLSFKNISVEQLLKLLSGDQVDATGALSGSLPLIIHRDGTYTIGQGGLQATQDGVIRMSGDVIPGNNEQVALVRQILQNLEYTVLTAAVTAQGPDKIAIKFSLEGRNPDVYDGKPVKLNVNLTGDLLDFARQNVMLLSNPEKLLTQEKQ